LCTQRYIVRAKMRDMILYHIQANDNVSSRKLILKNDVSPVTVSDQSTSMRPAVPWTIG